MNNLRITQVLKEDKWVEINFNDLKKGDVFRLFDISPVVVESGSSIFQASTDAYTTEEGLSEIGIIELISNPPQEAENNNVEG